MKTANFGSVSSGTLVTADLLDTFTDELKALQHPDAVSLQAEWFAIQDVVTADNPSAAAETLAGDILNEAMDALDECSPPYGYFGAHEGDGAGHFETSTVTLTAVKRDK